MKTWKNILAMLLALVMVLALCACGAEPAAEPAQEEAPAAEAAPAEEAAGEAAEEPAEPAEPAGPAKTSIVIGDVNTPCTFDATGRFFSHWEKMVFDCLVEYDTEGNVYPSIATDWEYTDDVTLVMHLRDDVYCTNGEQITASDCLWSLKFWATETSQASSFSAYDLENSFADDETNTLTIKFLKPWGPGILALGNFWMWDEEWATNASPEDWWGAPNGSGPFTVVENIDSDHITFQRKDDYFGELPEVETVTYRYYSEPATMFIDLENGDLDVAVNIQASDAERVLANPGDYESLAYEVRPLVDNMNLFLCDYTEYFQDENVRKAVFLALNGDEVGLGMYGALFQHADSPIPSGLQYHITTNLPEQNIEEAQKLMAESAYPNGFELRLVVTTGQDLAATVIQEQLSKIGITVNVETYDMGTAVPMMQKGEVDINIRVGMGGAPYRDAFMGIGDVYAYGSTMRATMMDDEEFNEHWEAATYSVDPAVRQENYEWMQNWLVDGCHVYPLAERCCFIAWQKDVVESCKAPSAAYLTGRTIDLVG